MQGSALGDIQGTQFTRPVVQVAEQLTVDALERGQVVGRKGELDFAGGNLGKRALRFVECFFCCQAQAIP
ncbi:hypothetical protein D9M68_949520 [compost metagenome]